MDYPDCATPLPLGKQVGFSNLEMSNTQFVAMAEDDPKHAGVPLSPDREQASDNLDGPEVHAAQLVEEEPKKTWKSGF